MTSGKWIFWGLFVLVTMGLVLSRLINLGGLPVFADEAIYIRWAQMIANDPQQYLFLPMYDGKTPLQMWFLIPFLAFKYSEPVLMGRMLSVIAGLGTMLTLMAIVKSLKGKQLAILIVGFLYMVLPYTFFHDRMALTDTLYTLFLALLFWSLLKLKHYLNWLWVVIAGLFFGLALLTKLPGLTFLLQFLLILWLMPPRLRPPQQQQAAKLFGIAALLGLAILYGLRVSPLFPFLFQRGSDFTFSGRDLLTGQWPNWWLNLRQLFFWQGWYATLGLWLLTLSPLIFRTAHQSQTIKTVGKLLIMTLSLVLYFLVFGKIVYSRYYLPTIIYLIPAAALAFEWLWNQGKRWLVIGLAALIVGQGLWFAWPFWTNIKEVRLEKKDQEQYLTEWSAGFGNRQVAVFLKQKALAAPVAVATEGFFGTLPDGLSIYFDHSPLNEKVKIFGVGQPINGVYESIKEKLAVMDTYIVVNQNRLNFDYTQCCLLVAKYDRPYGGAPLLLLKLNNL